MKEKSQIVTYFLIGLSMITVALGAFHWALAVGFLGLFLVIAATVEMQEWLMKNGRGK